MGLGASVILIRKESRKYRGFHYFITIGGSRHIKFWLVELTGRRPHLRLPTTVEPVLFVMTLI